MPHAARRLLGSGAEIYDKTAGQCGFYRTWLGSPTTPWCEDGRMPTHYSFSRLALQRAKHTFPTRREDLAHRGSLIPFDQFVEIDKLRGKLAGDERPYRRLAGSGESDEQYVPSHPNRPDSSTFHRVESRAT